MKISGLLKLRMSKSVLISVFYTMLGFSLVSLSIIAAMNTIPKGNYAFAQSASILRTMEMKVDYKKLVELGNNENIRVRLNDLATGDPISSASVRITVYFPSGTPVRTFMLLTDRNGDASLTLPIANNAALGQYGFDVLASALGYFDTAVGTINFAVMSQVDQNVDLNDYDHTSHTLSDHSGDNNHHKHHKHHNHDD